MAAMCNRYVVLKILGISLALGVTAAAQQLSPEAVRKTVREYRQQHEAEIVRSYAELLSLPDVASDTVNIRRNADFISAAL